MSRLPVVMRQLSSGGGRALLPFLGQVIGPGQEEQQREKKEAGRWRRELPCIASRKLQQRMRCPPFTSGGGVSLWGKSRSVRAMASGERPRHVSPGPRSLAEILRSGGGRAFCSMKAPAAS